MKNKLNKSGIWLLIVVSLALFTTLSGFKPLQATKKTSCGAPVVYLSSQAPGTISFQWNSVSGASGYIVYYVRQNGNYVSPQTFTTSTSITFTGLPSGTYDFYFATLCGSEQSEFIIVEDLVL